MKKIVKWVGLGIVVVFFLLAGIGAGEEIIRNYLGWNDDEETRVHKTIEKWQSLLIKIYQSRLVKTHGLKSKLVLQKINLSIDTL